MPVREVIFYDFDDFRLDVKRQELLKDGNPVPLTHKAFQILLLLVQNFGQTVEKENIYQQLWADSFVEDANLTQHIYILRKTLGQTPSQEPYIETVARLGYRFNAKVKITYPNNVVPLAEPVKNLADDISLAENETAEISRTRTPHLRLAENKSNSPASSGKRLEIEEAPSPTSRASVSFKDKKLVLAVFIVTLIAAIGIGYYFYRQPAAPHQPQIVKSIAILPFKPIGEESQNEKMGFGMADAIITRLSKLQQIPVRPTSAVFPYTDQPANNSLTAGKELNVDTVLEGTVQRDNKRVRVSVKLINISDGRTIWAENFDEDSTDIFNVQDSISTKVAHALEIKLTHQEKQLLGQHSTSSTEAFEAYQMGVYFGNKRNKENLEKAVTYFQRAIELDPNYAKAYAMLADSYNMLGYYRFSDPPEMWARSRVAAEKALELNDSLAEAYIALAFLPTAVPNAGEKRKKMLERAIELSPYNSTARIRYGWILLAEDDINGTVNQMRLAQEYDPLSGVANGALCNALIYQKSLEEAVKFCEKSVEISPQDAVNRILLADAYFLTGRYEDAIVQIKKRITETEGVENLTANGSLAFYYAKIGRRAEAEQILNQLKSQVKNYPRLLNDLFLISYALGNREEAFSYFEQAYDKRLFQLAALRYNPIWADVASDPKVNELLKRMNKDSN